MSNIVIVGDGAIGLLYSYFLSATNNVTLITRSKKSGQQYYYQGNNGKQLIKIKTLNNQNLTCLGGIDIVIIAVKAYQVQTALSQLTPYLHDSCEVILSHNGMTDLAPIMGMLNEQPVYFLTTRLAGFKANSATVIHTGNGESILGACYSAADKKYHTLVSTLCAIPSLSYSEQIDTIRWQKLLINIAINPLSAFYNVKNGALNSPKYNSDIFNLVSEACFVANKLGAGVTLPDSLENAYKVMSATADNFSSMHQDSVHNRPTEIDAMCGYICQQAKLLNLKAPYNQYYLDKIRHKKSAN
ncbi:ketopantoate reductase family protein [Pseudoalteromonas sp. H105]|jgi:2-dehydropantoate 2-reductase|uniref:ketopantoate reductase family protein n=1 Tax=Pseudoalteromonas sp. H105 TaxID=1348393 RepID=UPI00073209F6|nr:2-dehydropantoate 2-reductase [Pseudoalteromonas sp. H105]KTF12304.1 2-dehydropantoate 2-reductase [Pseudoalteromonas sp. H105]